MDPVLAASQTRKIQSDVAAAQSVIEQWERSQTNAVPQKEWEVRDTLTQAGGLVLMLARSDRAERAALYRALGLNVSYEKEAPTGQERVHARMGLCRGGGGI